MICTRLHFSPTLSFVEFALILYCSNCAQDFLNMTEMVLKSARKAPDRVVGGKYLFMFRKIVRKVILKKFWQGIFDANLSLDKIRSTHHIFRPIGHKELLFQQERRILSIPFQERDEIHWKIAELIITKLHCLQRFEPVGNVQTVVLYNV